MQQQPYADWLRDTASRASVERIMNAVNQMMGERQVHRAEVTMACVQMLAQEIVTAGDLWAAPEVRGAIIALIDAFAMQLATDRDK